MEQILTVVGSYGALGACLVYFMLQDIERRKAEREDKARTQEQFQNVVEDFRDILQEIRDMLLTGKGVV